MKLAELFEQLNEAVDVTQFDVDSITPEKKDYDRAEGLRFQGRTFKGNMEPFVGEASKMAKLIKDPTKMVRRAKAVASMYGSTKAASYTGFYTPEQYNEIWAPFADGLRRLGFTSEQIKQISKYVDKKDQSK